MRRTFAGLLGAVILTAGVVAPAAAQNPGSTEPEGMTVMPEVTVKVTDRGERPRKRLRYDWSLGQIEGVEIDFSMDTDVSLGIQSSGVVPIPTMRMAATIEVVEARPDGTYLLETVFKDVGVPIGASDGILATQQVEQQLRTLEGMTERSLVDTQGKVLASEIDMPPDVPADLLESMQSGVETAGQSLVIFPSEPVGVGAEWRITQRLSDDMGFDVKQVERVKLLGLEDGVATVELTVRQVARDQDLVVPDMPAGMTFTLDTHDVRGTGAADVDLAALAQKTAQQLKSRSTFEMRVGDQSQSMIVGFDIEADIEPIPADRVPDPDPRPVVAVAGAMSRHEVADEDLAISFPSAWRVGRTNPNDHPWLYPDDPGEDPGFYGILIATGPGQKCTVEDDTGWGQEPPAFEGLKDVVGNQLDWTGRDPDVKASSSRFYDLPAGRAARIDVEWHDGLFETYYWFMRGTKLNEVNCWSNDPPDDRWLSIAKTFAYLTDGAQVIDAGEGAPASAAAPTASRTPAPTPAPTATPSPIDVEVLANDPEGVLVGDFEVGQLVALGVAGTWCASATEGDCGGPGGFGGTLAGDGFEEAPVGALLVQQTGAGQPQVVGDETTVEVRSAGPLRLYFNDSSCCYSDNHGSVWVHVLPFDV